MGPPSLCGPSQTETSLCGAWLLYPGTWQTELHASQRDCPPVTRSRCRCSCSCSVTGHYAGWIYEEQGKARQTALSATSRRWPAAVLIGFMPATFTVRRRTEWHAVNMSGDKPPRHVNALVVHLENVGQVTWFCRNWQRTLPGRRTA
jgi:hypothetical protein